MLLGQERLPKRPPPLPPRQGNSKAPTGSEFTSSSNGSHLFGCHGSTGEPRGFGGGQDGKGGRVRRASQNISPGKKRKQHRRPQYQECPPHTATHHSPHTRHNNPCLPPIPPRCSLALPLFAFQPLARWTVASSPLLEGKC